MTRNTVVNLGLLATLVAIVSLSAVFGEDQPSANATYAILADVEQLELDYPHRSYPCYLAAASTLNGHWQAISTFPEATLECSRKLVAQVALK